MATVGPFLIFPSQAEGKALCLVLSLNIVFETFSVFPSHADKHEKPLKIYGVSMS